MAVRVFLDPTPGSVDFDLGEIVFAEAVPRVGDYVRYSAKLHSGGTRVLSGQVTRIETEIGDEPDGSYVIVSFTIE